MEKIVVLDGYAANPGDVGWQAFAGFGQLAVHDRTRTSQVVERVGDATLLLTNKTPVRAEALAALPNLRYIGVLATGYNIDIAAARQRGIVVSNVPGYSTDSVAQLVFALILEQSMRVGDHNRAVHAGDWASCQDFCFWRSPLVELAGKTIGIVGYGAIGQRIGQIATAFGMRVLATARTARPMVGAQAVDLPTLLRESHFVTLNCPLTAETTGLINDERIAMMRPGAVLINTARGGLLDEAAVARALTDGRLAAAALDVLSVQPPPATNPLLSAPNCIITPHIAWATVEARRRLLAVAADNLRAFLAGHPVNTVT